MTDHTALQSLIEAAFEQRAEITPKSIRLRKKVLAGNMRSVVRTERDDD